MLVSLLIYKDWCCFAQKQAQVGTKARLASSAFSPLSHACCVSPDCAPHQNPIASPHQLQLPGMQLPWMTHP